MSSSRLSITLWELATTPIGAAARGRGAGYLLEHHPRGGRVFPVPGAPVPAGRPRSSPRPAGPLGPRPFPDDERHGVGRERRAPVEQPEPCGASGGGRPAEPPSRAASAIPRPPVLEEGRPPRPELARRHLSFLKENQPASGSCRPVRALSDVRSCPAGTTSTTSEPALSFHAPGRARYSCTSASFFRPVTGGCPGTTTSIRQDSCSVPRRIRVSARHLRSDPSTRGPPPARRRDSPSAWPPTPAAAGGPGRPRRTRAGATPASPRASLPRPPRAPTAAVRPPREQPLLQLLQCALALRSAVVRGPQYSSGSSSRSPSPNSPATPAATGAPHTWPSRRARCTPASPRAVGPVAASSHAR